MSIVLVTGGNRGIGLEICRQLDEAGHIVILGSRDPEKGRKAALSSSERVKVKQLDVTDEESIINLYNSILAEFGKLDVLINNAGIGANQAGDENALLGSVKKFIKSNLHSTWKAAKTSFPGLQKIITGSHRKGAGDVPLINAKYVMETNFYGAWRMIQVFLPLLEKSEDPRIINISSGMGELKSLTGVYPAYSLSKASLNALTIMFSNELRGKGIKVNAIDPGWVKTDMGGPDAPLEVRQGADTAVWLATEKAIPTGKFFRDRKEISW